MSTKPTDVLGWTAASGTIVEPSGTDKDNGFAPNQKPPSSWFNWFWELTSQWVQYLNDVFPDGEILIGEDIVGNLTDALKSRIKFLITSHTTSTRTAILDIGIIAPGMRVYHYSTDTLGYTLEIVSNAYWDGTDWKRQAGGTHSSILRLSHTGLIIYAYRPSSSGNTWDDTYGVSGGWTTKIFSADTTAARLAGTLTVDGAMQVVGAAVFDSDVAITGDISGPLGGTLTVGTDLVVGDDLTVTDTASVGTTLSVGTDLTVGDDLSVTDDAAIGGDITVAGQATIEGHTTINAVLTVGNDVEVTGDISATANISAGGDITTSGFGLLSTDLIFYSSAYTGAGPDSLRLAGLESTALGEAIHRRRAGKLRSIRAKSDATPDAGKPITIEVKAQSGASHISLGTLVLPDSATAISSGDLSASYPAGYSLYVYASSTAQSAHELLVNIVIQE